MSQCPHCQHTLSQDELHSGKCPSCGHAWQSPRPDAPPKPGSVLGDFAEDSLPQAISGVGKHGTGLSSATEPETWNVDSNAVTHDASELLEARQRGPQPLELGADDIVRMSILWQGIEDEVPAGMTIKSQEVDIDDLDEKMGTVDVAELQNAEDLEDVFRADESSKTFSPGVEPADNGSGAEAGSSDEFPSASSGRKSSAEKEWLQDSISDTFLSDDFPSILPEAEEKITADSQSHDTPSQSAGTSSYDQTFVAPDSVSAEQDSDSQNFSDEEGKTLPLSGEGDWIAAEDSKTFAGAGSPQGARTTEDDASIPGGQDSADIEKTLISNDLSGENYTDSGSTDGGRRTDPLASGEILGPDLAEGTGLVIQTRSLRPQDEAESDSADYQILSLLGEGGMGQVFNARQTSIDRVVAVKMLKARSSSRKRDQHTKFLAEAVVTGELDHPNIVPIYDVGRDQNNALFYSMKNVTGNPWLDTIHQKSVHDNLEILMSVADAVAFAHARGVVHRDLKPENVMLGEFGEVLLMDWGLAMPTDRFRKQRGIVRSSSMGGTPAYMAPEMATGPITKIGSHSDIYLLGAILFEIVTGRPPHRGKNAMKCLMSAARNKIVHTEHTGELIEIAYKAMSTDPKDRYKSVQEFQAAVRTYLAHSESINLAAVAEEDLERAQKTDSYEDYAKARFGFEEALKLWEGNKRARSSLAAARLAYAHCAMGKEDYDLAASLLDTSDKTHDKLRVDIAKAREERDARQKRLEAAKRAGRVMLAALFLVVTGATFWINNERAKAVASEKDAINAKELADEARREAEDQRVKAQRLADQERDLKEAAEEARDEARQANVIAEQRRKAALAQQIMASLNALLAEEQRLVAEEQRRIAEQAKKDVEEALVRVQDARRQEAEQRALAEAQKVMAGINAIYAEQQALVAQQAADAERAAKEQEARQRRLAVKQRELAEAQQVVAGLNAIMADEQKQLAEVQRRAADLQRQLAEDARKEAVKAQKAAEEAKLAEEQEAYISKVGLAAAKIEANAFDAAKELLLGTNPIFRNWEWGYLTHLCESYDTEYKSSQRLESVALIGDGQQFVIAGEDGLVEIRSLEPVEGTPAVIQDLSLPNKANVYDIAVSPDGRYIALATDDVREGFIKLWDRSQNQWTPTRFGSTDVTFRSAEEYYEKHESRHMDPVVSVQFSQDGTKLLTGSEDKSARVWDVTTGRQLARLFGTDTLGQTASVWDAVFCPNFERDADDRILADRPLPETKVLTACEDGKVRIWADAGGEWNDPAKIRLEGHFDAHQGSPVYSLACSPNGEYVVSGSFDRRVLLWRPKDIPQISQQRYYEMLINNEPVPQTPYRELVGHTGPVHCVRFGSTAPSDARSLVVLTCSDDNTVKVWSVDREASLGRVSPIKTFRGHGSYVRDCTFNPSGTWILSVSHDRTAKRWSVDEDAKTEVYLVNGSPLDGHKENVDAVAFSFNGKTKAVATASRDRTAQIYSLEGENHLKHEAVITEGHSNLIPSGVYFNDGKKLATAGFDNTARLWDARTGSEILKLERTGFAGVIAVSPDGRWILTGSDNPTQFETDAKRRIPWKAKLWDAESPEKPVLTFGRHLYEVTAVAFSNRIGPKGELLFATAGGAGICSVWRWTPGDKEPAEQQIVRFKGGLAHNDRIVGLRFLPGDQQLVSASYDYAVTCWDVTKEKPAAVWDLNHPKRVSSMDVTADGRLLVTTCFDDTIRIWNTQNHELVRELRPEGRVYTLLANVADELGRKKYPNNTLERAWRLINPDLNYQDFIKRGGWTQAVQSIQSQIPSQLADSLKEPPRQLARQLAELFDGVSAEDLLLPKTDSVAISPDGRYVVAANRIDRMAHGWRLSENLTADSQLTTFDIEGRTDEDVWAVLFSPEVMRANVVLLGFSDARQFHLNTAADGRVITTPSITWSGQEEVVSASFSPDGQYLVTGSRDRAARVWNVRTGRNLIKLEGAHTAPINAAVWAPRGIPGDPEGHYILTVSDLGRVTAALWKLTPFGEDGFRKELVRTFPGHTDNVLDAAFSPDGRWIVTVSRDRTIRLWETASGKEVTKSQPQEDAVLCVAFAADGKRILTGSAANEAVIWSVAVTEAAVRLEPQLLLEGHSAPVTDVAFSPLEDLNHDGRISEFERYALRAVTASDDNSVIVWDTRVPTYSEDAVPQANQVLTLKRHDRPVKAVQFSPDGRYILTGSEDHRAILWPSKDWMAEKLAEYEKNPNLKIPANSEVTASDEVSAK